MLETEILISLPKNFCSNKNGKRDDYARKYAEDLTEYLREHNRYAKELKYGIMINSTCRLRKNRKL